MRRRNQPWPRPRLRPGPLILQAFAWDMAPDASHWRYLAQHAQAIADLGVTIIWLPPAYKGNFGLDDVGYGVYDLYDLGEFDQKGTIPTKYGTRDEYLAAIDALHEAGIAVCADIVLNHRMGADATETVRATPINPQDRHQALGDPETIQAWTRFTFPGRGGAYSDFTWDWTCFHGIDWDEATQRKGLWLFEGKHWNESVNTEFGNFDYLMGCDVHVTEPRVSEELDRWGRWYVETTGVDALRLDAVKHVGSDFYARWLEDLRASTGRRLPAVGEYWSGDVRELEGYLERVPNVMLFDVPLHYHLHDASISDGNVDLSRLWENTLTASRPDKSVTFVETRHPARAVLGLHGRPLVQGSAYASSSFNEAGVPCVFWGDLLGSPDSDDLPPCVNCRSSCRFAPARPLARSTTLSTTLTSWALPAKASPRSPAPAAPSSSPTGWPQRRPSTWAIVTPARSGSASSEATRRCASRTTGHSPAWSATAASASTCRAPERITSPGLVHGDEAGER